MINSIQEHHPLVRPLHLSAPRTHIETIVKKLAGENSLDHILWIASRSSVENLLGTDIPAAEHSQEVVLCFRID